MLEIIVITIFQMFMVPEIRNILSDLRLVLNSSPIFQTITAQDVHLQDRDDQARGERVEHGQQVQL